MKAFLDILKQSKNEGKLVGLRMKNDDGDDFYLGIITDFNEILFVLNTVTKLGYYSGQTIDLIENIESIDYDDEYNEAYQYLINQINSPNKLIDITLPTNDNWKYGVLKGLKKSVKYITLDIDDSSIFGKLISFDKESVTILGISNIGKSEGKSIYRLSDVTGFTFNNLEDNKRAFLYEWRESRN